MGYDASVVACLPPFDFLLLFAARRQVGVFFGGFKAGATGVDRIWRGGSNARVIGHGAPLPSPAVHAEHCALFAQLSQNAQSALYDHVRIGVA